MKSIIHTIISLHTNEGFTLPNKEISAQTKDFGKVLKMRTNEKHTNEIRTNQGLGVFKSIELFMFQVIIVRGAEGHDLIL